jgi:DNA adenine methylase
VLLGHSGDGRSELVNDLDGDLINFWRMLQEPSAFAELNRLANMTPLARDGWIQTHEALRHPSAEPIARAWAFFVFCRQSRAGQMESFTSPSRTRTRRGMNGNVSEWLGAVEGLPEVHARLKRVMIENMDALKLIPREDTPDTLFYIDPPYAAETRTAGGYRHEMTAEQHEQLLCIISRIKGKFLLSGYPSQMYTSHQSRFGWNRHDFDIANNAAGGEEKRRMVECVWCNF